MQSPSSFNARAARVLREKLGLEHEHVAYGIRAPYGMEYVTAQHIAAWERGDAVPSITELQALAGALWCSPAEIMTEPRTLLEHRLARGVAIADIVRVTGLSIDDYQRIEATGEWTGSERQAFMLCSLLELPTRAYLFLIGHEQELARLLEEAVSTRWQAHARAIAALINRERGELKPVLRAMHGEYQNLIAATLSRAGGSTASGGAARRYLDEIVDIFWQRLDGPRS